MPGVIVQSNSSSTLLGFGSSHPDSSCRFISWTSPVFRLTNCRFLLPAAQIHVASRSYDGLSVMDIRQRAKDSVHKEAKGIPAISLIRTARTQILMARDYEAKGDLRNALATYIKAATLTKMAMDSQEYLQENRGKGGIIRKELHDFLEVCSLPQLLGPDLYIRQSEGRDLTKRTNAIEDKLKAIEVTQSRCVSHCSVA